MSQLKKQGINSCSGVFLATFNAPDKIIIDLYKDQCNKVKLIQIDFYSCKFLL
jgi:hypothetical protein